MDRAYVRYTNNTVLGRTNRFHLPLEKTLTTSIPHSTRVCNSCFPFHLGSRINSDRIRRIVETYTRIWCLLDQVCTVLILARISTPFHSRTVLTIDLVVENVFLEITLMSPRRNISIIPLLPLLRCIDVAFASYFSFSYPSGILQLALMELYYCKNSQLN